MEAVMAFYEYRQNNSGGGFDFEEGKLSHLVVIEADTADDADDIAQGLGIYFNGCDTGSDCECCGDRWTEASDWNKSDKPHSYGQELELIDGEYVEWSNWDMRWMGDNPDGYVHFKDGLTVPIRTKKRQQVEA